MSTITAPMTGYWRGRSDRRRNKRLPPEKMDELLRKPGDPYAAARVLDPLLLSEFVKHGLRITHRERIAWTLCGASFHQQL